MNVFIGALPLGRLFIPELRMNLVNDPAAACPLGVLAPVTPHWLGIVKTPPGGPLPELGQRLPSYAECISLCGEDGGGLADPDLEVTNFSPLLGVCLSNHNGTMGKP